jgi:hypothetical protein
MKYLKKFNEATTTEVVDKLLVQLSSANSAGESKKHWTIGDPRVSDVTHECKYIGRSLTNEQYTKIILASFNQLGELMDQLLNEINNRGLDRNTLRSKIRRKVTTRSDIQMNRDVNCNKFKGYDKEIKMFIHEFLKSNGYVESNSDIWKVINKDDYEKECEFLNKLFSLSEYINNGKSDDDIKSNNDEIKDLLKDIDTISYIIEDEGYSFSYNSILFLNSIKLFGNLELDNKYYTSGISIEIKDSTQFDSHLKEFLDKLVGLLRDHLDYIPSENIVTEGERVIIIL